MWTEIVARCARTFSLSLHLYHHHLCVRVCGKRSIERLYMDTFMVHINQWPTNKLTRCYELRTNKDHIVITASMLSHRSNRKYFLGFFSALSKAWHYQYPFKMNGVAGTEQRTARFYVFVYLVDQMLFREGLLFSA